MHACQYVQRFDWWSRSVWYTKNSGFGHISSSCPLLSSEVSIKASYRQSITAYRASYCHLLRFSERGPCSPFPSLSCLFHHQQLLMEKSYWNPCIMSIQLIPSHLSVYQKQSNHFPKSLVSGRAQNLLLSSHKVSLFPYISPSTSPPTKSGNLMTNAFLNVLLLF